MEIHAFVASWLDLLYKAIHGVDHEGHPKTKAGATHSGHLAKQESVEHITPLLCTLLWLLIEL